MKVIFCTLPVFSDWIGIIALIIGIAGFVLTLLTFWKVKTIQAVVEELQNRHLLQVRLPEILEELKRVSVELFDLNTWTTEAKTIYRFQNNISTVRVNCNSIKRYLGNNNKMDRRKYDEAGFSSLEPLSTLLEEQTTIFDESFCVRYRSLLSDLVAEIESFLKEKEAKIQ